MDDIERLPSITARRTFQGCVLAGLAQLQFVTRGRHSKAWQLPYGQGTFLFLTTRRMMADVHGKTDRCKTQQARSLRSGTLKIPPGGTGPTSRSRRLYFSSWIRASSDYHSTRIISNPALLPILTLSDNDHGCSRRHSRPSAGLSQLSTTPTKSPCVVVGIVGHARRTHTSNILDASHSHSAWGPTDVRTWRRVPQPIFRATRLPGGCCEPLLQLCTHRGYQAQRRQQFSVHSPGSHGELHRC
ncbi:hypothetical protein N656DRAFT_390003 [Canariomyces notabilis]|uniref:Uncharacterized protein n=1 Tax=Canariomyces notabilis TaxID=2074819 RepID=A0AAN6YWM5_9PEZI|nr:hypothetical protein N656DRAFT_390003 [Canariomyces arenarius]